MSEIKQSRKNNFVDYTEEFNTFLRCYKCKKPTPGGINDYLDKRNNKPTKCCKKCRNYLLMNTKKTMAKYPNKIYAAKKNKLTKSETIVCMHKIIDTFINDKSLIPILIEDNENFKLLLKEFPDFNKLFGE